MRNLAGKLKDENVSLVRMHEQAATQIASAEARVAELDQHVDRLYVSIKLMCARAERAEAELRQERLIRDARAQDVAAIVAEKGALLELLRSIVYRLNGGRVATSIAIIVDCDAAIDAARSKP